MPYTKQLRRSVYSTDPPSQPPSPPPSVHPGNSDGAVPDAGDIALLGAVMAALDAAGLPGDGVKVSVLDRLVTLSGQVRDRRMKFRIEHAVAQVEGVVDVENLLRVPGRR